MIIFAADDPLVLNGTYDQEGYTPKERRAQQQRQRAATKGSDMPTPNARSKRQKAAKPRHARKGAAKAREPRARQAKAREPRRQPPLTGMEDVRIGPLDDICASIAETRESQNDLRKQGVDYEKTALSLMRAHKKTAWRHAGVELVRVPGEEKLRVRTAHEPTATAEVEPEADAQQDAEPAESGEAGDAGEGIGSDEEVERAF